MNCQEAELLISQSLDGELDSPASQSLLQEHLESCPACRNRAQTWRNFGQFMRQDEISAPPPAEAAWREIRREIQSGESPRAEEIPGKTATASPWFWRAPAAMAALLALSLGLYFVLPSSKENATAYADATVVEFMETEIPGAGTLVYVDEDSGWTILWVVEPAAEG